LKVQKIYLINKVNNIEFYTLIELLRYYKEKKVWRKATHKHTHQEETNQSSFIIIFSKNCVLM